MKLNQKKKNNKDYNYYPIPEAKVHNSNSTDNLRKKIASHFYDFSIAYINMMIRSKWKSQPYKLKRIGYKIKSNVTSKHMTSLQATTLEEVLSSNISAQYLKYKPDCNKIVIENLKNYPEFNSFLQMTFGYFYSEFYLRKTKRDLEQTYDMKNISLFENLHTELCKGKNVDFKKRLEVVASRLFIFRKKDKLFYHIPEKP